MIKKFIPLLLISVCIGDTLILKDKTVYTGALIKFGTDEIIFKAIPSAKLSIYISDIQELKLSDGTIAFENGTSMDLKKLRRYIEMVKLEQSRNNAIVCCSIIIILGLITFFNLSFGPAPPWPSGVY